MTLLGPNEFELDIKPFLQPMEKVNYDSDQFYLCCTNVIQVTRAKNILEEDKPECRET